MIGGPRPLPEGFSMAAVDAGITKDPRLDLALVVAEEAFPAAAVFTKNLVVAAPVALDRSQLERSGGRVRAILMNAGCANACTGPEGDEDAVAEVRMVAGALECPEEQVLVFSTGVIGTRLPIGRIEQALPDLIANLSSGTRALEDGGRAILTTDTRPKMGSVSWKARSSSQDPEGEKGEASLIGFAKGSGMIHPDMATMLAFLLSDADPDLDLRALLSGVVNQSFHRITVDGDGSTNDSVFLWTSGRRRLAEGEDFVEGLDALALHLAKEIARDGEGATKLLEVRVGKAFSPIHARACAKAVASSLLVKTAVHGGDPNWGRILAAAGRSGIDLDTRRVRVGIGPVCLFEEDRPRPENEEEAAAHLEGAEVLIWLELGTGECGDSVFTCDLSEEYVRINADYRT